jgi:hypothetical protein
VSLCPQRLSWLAPLLDVSGSSTRVCFPSSQDPTTGQRSSILCRLCCNDSMPATLRAQPKALRSSAVPAGEGVLIPSHAGHASHAACACALSQTLEQTCKAAALLRSLSAAQPL